MLKVVCLIRRRQDLAWPEFVDRYENGHAVLCAEIIPHLRKYLRRYVSTSDVVCYPGAAPPDFDVITELWFDNRADYESAMRTLSEGETARILAADEAALFDLASIRRMVVNEHESPLDAGTEQTVALAKLIAQVATMDPAHLAALGTGRATGEDDVIDGSQPPANG